MVNLSLERGNCDGFLRSLSGHPDCARASETTRRLRFVVLVRIG